MKIENHPCFNPGACKSFGRVHLPVAPRCNVQCNFCNRKFDCVNETRPGVTSSILKPFQALRYLDEVMERMKNISVMGIAGPGDPFANPEETLTTLRLVREKYPELLLCVATNGLNLPPYLDEVASLSVSHVSITVNAVDPKIGAKVYSWVRYGKRTLNPEKGAQVLLENQLASIKGLKERGVVVKVNTIVLPGINDDHMEAIAEKMAELEVDILNCMPYFPNKGSNFEHLPEPGKDVIAEIRKKASVHIPQMLHCKRCRADAVGLLDEAPDIRLMNRLKDCATLSDTAEKTTPATPEAVPVRPHVAVASREGVLVNEHLGEAKRLMIYGMEDGEPTMVDRRLTPSPGMSDTRWEEIAELLTDCRTLLVSGIGAKPRRVLTEAGIEIKEVGGLIDEAVSGIFDGSNIGHMIKRERTHCGADCSGGGMGCM